MSAPEIQIGDIVHRVRRLCAADQFALLHRITAVLPGLFQAETGLRNEKLSLTTALAAVRPLLAAADADVEEAFALCRRACEPPIPEDAGLTDMMAALVAVAGENLGPYFAVKRTAFTPAPRDGLDYQPVAMADGEDWLFRPFVRGRCSLESLYDGTLGLEHVAKANDALDVADENEVRARNAAQAQAKRN